MKIAYLMYSDHNKANEIVATINELVKQGDHVFLMVNEPKIRDKVAVATINSRRIHISHNQEYAQEGDLSLARGTLLQMKEAVQFEDETFDRFINLGEGMLPLMSRDKIVKFLEENDTDFYYVAATEKDDPTLRKTVVRYYPFTSIVDFANKKKFRRYNIHMAAFLNFFGSHRKLEDPIEIGSPWFILKRDTAAVLAENFAYCSENFKLGWYAEENVYPMMIHKFMPEETHVNKDMRVIGPDGTWVRNQGLRDLPREVLEKYPDALFGGAFYHEKDTELFNEILDRYNAEQDDSNDEQTPNDEAKLNRIVDTISKQL